MAANNREKYKKSFMYFDSIIGYFLNSFVHGARRLKYHKQLLLAFCALLVLLLWRESGKFSRNATEAVTMPDGGIIAPNHYDLIKMDGSVENNPDKTNKPKQFFLTMETQNKKGKIPDHIGQVWEIFDDFPMKLISAETEDLKIDKSSDKLSYILKMTVNQERYNTFTDKLLEMAEANGYPCKQEKIKTRWMGLVSRYGSGGKGTTFYKLRNLIHDERFEEVKDIKGFRILVIKNLSVTNIDKNGTANFEVDVVSIDFPEECSQILECRLNIPFSSTTYFFNRNNQWVYKNHNKIREPVWQETYAISQGSACGWIIAPLVLSTTGYGFIADPLIFRGELKLKESIINDFNALRTLVHIDPDIAPRSYDKNNLIVNGTFKEQERLWLQQISENPSNHIQYAISNVNGRIGQ